MVAKGSRLLKLLTLFVCSATRHRKSVGFACDLQLKKGTSGEFFACGRPGVSTALCLEWPLEIKVASFITKVAVPICLPDARALEASLRFLGGDVTAIINLLV